MAIDSLYSGIFRRAWKTTWHHRELWPIAAVAGVLGSGSVFLEIIRQGNLLSWFAAIDWQQLAPWGDLFAATVNDISLLHGPVWTLLMLSLFLGIGLVYALLVGAQHALLRTGHRAAHQKARFTFSELAFEIIHPRFGSMALINAASKILTILLLLIGGLQLQSLTITEPFDVFFGGIYSVTIVGLCFVINTVAMLALTEIAEDHRTLQHALAFAWKSFVRSPLVAIELAALQFGAQLLGSLVFLACIGATTIVTNALIPLLVSTESLTLIAGAAICGILIALTAAVAAAGALVTFTYAVWTEFAHQERKAPKPAKLARVTRRHFWV